MNVTNEDIGTLVDKVEANPRHQIDEYLMDIAKENPALLHFIKDYANAQRRA